MLRPICTSVTFWCNTTEAGEVTLNSADPMDVPKISPKLNSLGDVVKLRKAVQFINNAMEKPGLAQFHPRSLRGLETMTAAELDATIHKHGQEFYHPSGTCKMGDPSKDESVVVDSHCRVVGIQGLRVADASIHPTEITVAICAGCIVAGEKCAAMIIQEHGLMPADEFLKPSFSPRNGKARAGANRGKPLEMV